jgi:hypothetical protein
VQGYTAKQWETDPKLLPAEVISRLPVRFNFNDFYFNDIYEGLPVDGYHAIFDRIFADPRITTVTGIDYFDVRDQIRDDAIVIYTGAIDRFYDYQFGPLSWRTLDFEIERPAVDDFQGASVVNYPDQQVPYTRIHEFKHLHPSAVTRREDPDHAGVLALRRIERRAVLPGEHAGRQADVRQVCRECCAGKERDFRGAVGDLPISRHASGHRCGVEVV